MIVREVVNPPAAPTRGTSVSPVRFEHRDLALGIGTPTPRLSWQVTTDDPAWSQTAYEIEAEGKSVRVESDEQILVPWPFEPLRSRERVAVRVRVASGEKWSTWSEPATVEVALLKPEDWTARFISPVGIGRWEDPAPILAQTFSLRSDVTNARLYITAHGLHHATINGMPAGDELLAPGWTAYQHRLQYQTYDVTHLLHEGQNELDVLLGNGWYRGRISWRAVYGDRLALLAQLEVTYSDGSKESFSTGHDWSARNSNVLANDLYDGQRMDLRKRSEDAHPVEVLEEDLGRLVAPEGPPVRATEYLPARRVWRSPSGKTLVDFGQNIAGWVRISVDGVEGQQVTVRHAEILEHGELATRFLVTAEATDTYILPDGISHLEPNFTYHGFRYAEITGIDDLSIEDVQAVVVGSDLRRTGWFECSDPDLTKFHENVVWSARSNLLHVPTDCAHRSERLGWTGDIQIFSPAAASILDVAGFLSSWLTDLAAEQYPDGLVPYIVPDVGGVTVSAAAGWSDAATIIPWVLYQRYGDLDVLRRQYESMRSWVDRAASLTTDGVWAGGFQFGDWLDPTAPPDAPYDVRANPDVIATAYLIRSADIMAEAARLLGHDEDVTKYLKLADETRTAFARHYVTPAGRVLSDVPTVYALALEWKLLPTAHQRERAGARLADLVRSSGFRISTGFIGTPLITDALCTAGRPDLAYRLMLEKGCPSWLYPVTMGATASWERWDAIRPDGSLNPNKYTSFNLYALGAVTDWVHRTVAGITPTAPGYREFTVKPIPHRDLTSAKAVRHTPFGEISVSWSCNNGRFYLHAVVPVGSRATVELPDGSRASVGHGSYRWTVRVPPEPQRPVRTIRDVIDDPDLWADTIARFAAEGLGDDPATFARQLTRYLEFPAEELIWRIREEAHAVPEPKTPQARVSARVRSNRNVEPMMD
ncbi:alpha-L-rhamnosidase [Amycolatopsis sacchari]|uniref:alpha-L-rhamnosidase n=1 Tax=Amycolatopsis sacchari TaxID=115433 RepID=A0A1I4CPT7_9PSEU|nr:alpha-L-rhamnosidase [Amycolatopsis sacchari]